MSYCSDLGYEVGDLFKVVRVGAGLSEYVTEGMVVKLNRDDQTDTPCFSYVSGNVATYTEEVKDFLWISVLDLKKIEATTEKVTGEPLYSASDIELAFNELEWLDCSFDKLITQLKQQSDPEYSEYKRLKAKFG